MVRGAWGTSSRNKRSRQQQPIAHELPIPPSRPSPVPPSHNFPCSACPFAPFTPTSVSHAFPLPSAPSLLPDPIPLSSSLTPSPSPVPLPLPSLPAQTCAERIPAVCTAWEPAVPPEFSASMTLPFFLQPAHLPPYFTCPLYPCIPFASCPPQPRSPSLDSLPAPRVLRSTCAGRSPPESTAQAPAVPPEPGRRPGPEQHLQQHPKPSMQQHQSRVQTRALPPWQCHGASGSVSPCVSRR